MTSRHGCGRRWVAAMAVNILGAIAFLAVWTGLLWFMVRFHWLTRGDWRKTKEGRWFMYFTASAWMVMTWTGVRNFFPIPETVSRAIGLGFFSVYGVFVWRQAIIMEQVQRQAHVAQHREGTRDAS